jgi:hypothetical protein
MNTWLETENCRKSNLKMLKIRDKKNTFSTVKRQANISECHRLKTEQAVLTTAGRVLKMSEVCAQQDKATVML